MSPTRRTVLKWGIGGGAIAVAPGITSAAPARADTPSTPGGQPTDSWLAHLPDTVPLTALTIPGTHDSCCQNPAYGTEWSHTQNWGIPQQLTEGVRFLDIRCNGLAGTASELGIYHSSWYQYIRLQDVLDQCRSFLAAHPSETVVMRLRNENAGGQALTDTEFCRRFNYYLDDLGYRPAFHLYGWPALSTARGKIVLLADFGFPAQWGLISWSSGTNDYMITQDTFDTVGLDTKGQLIINQFDQAYSNPASAQMYVNFLSYAGGTWPKLNEQYVMDHAVYPYLSARTAQHARFGIVPMDFPDFHVNVLQMLVDKNFV
ncbi:MAG: phosphatidylinositol-specific phospholipase C domain-containing protein [Catenulispora sp.]|nr:phosphatidylinositol-specific phospholipase C domain-containing protein [Catenulispora sp.]